MPDATLLTVEPASEDDWELIEIHADHMEEQLLNQVPIQCSANDKEQACVLHKGLVY